MYLVFTDNSWCVIQPSLVPVWLIHHKTWLKSLKPCLWRNYCCWTSLSNRTFLLFISVACFFFRYDLIINLIFYIIRLLLKRMKREEKVKAKGKRVPRKLCGEMKWSHGSVTKFDFELDCPTLRTVRSPCIVSLSEALDSEEWLSIQSN